MAHFARLDENNIVISVHPIDNSNCIDADGNENESIGVSYCKSFYGNDTNWIQVSYNDNKHNHYPGIGQQYVNVDRLSSYSISGYPDGIFTVAQPHPSWNLFSEETDRFEWKPPIESPSLTSDDILYRRKYEWNEEGYNHAIEVLSQDDAGDVTQEMLETKIHYMWFLRSVV